MEKYKDKDGNIVEVCVIKADVVCVVKNEEAVFLTTQKFESTYEKVEDDK